MKWQEQQTKLGESVEYRDPTQAKGAVEPDAPTPEVARRPSHAQLVSNGERGPGRLMDGSDLILVAAQLSRTPIAPLDPVSAL